jgi:hypothetical protein
MPLVSVPFPVSAAPGQFPGEGSGDLVNVYAEKNGPELSWKRIPGLGLINTLTGYLSPRGFLYTGTTLYGAYAGKLITISSAGVVTAIGGTLPGAERVTIAINDLAPTPAVVVVSDTGAYALSGATLISFPDPDVGSPNSVSTFHNYFMFTYGNGKIIASDLNADATGANPINPLSVAKAAELPDGLLRGVTFGTNWLAFGDASTQFWQDAGTSPFPLALAHTMPVGLVRALGGRGLRIRLGSPADVRRQRWHRAGAQRLRGANRLDAGCLVRHQQDALYARIAAGERLYLR